MNQLNRDYGSSLEFSHRPRTETPHTFRLKISRTMADSDIDIDDIWGEEVRWHAFQSLIQDLNLPSAGLAQRFVSKEGRRGRRRMDIIFSGSSVDSFGLRFQRRSSTNLLRASTPMYSTVCLFRNRQTWWLRDFLFQYSRGAEFSCSVRTSRERSRTGFAAKFWL